MAAPRDLDAGGVNDETRALLMARPRETPMKWAYHHQLAPEC